MIFLDMSDHVTGGGVRLVTLRTRVSDALVKVSMMSPHCVPVKEGGLTDRTFSWLFGCSSGPCCEFIIIFLCWVLHQL